MTYMLYHYDFHCIYNNFLFNSMTSLYASNLLDSLAPVIHQSVEQRALLDDFIFCIKSRISAEQHYAKELTKISDDLDKYLQKSEQSKTSVAFLFAALKSDATRRAFQVYSFSESLKTEILVPTKQMSQSQTVQSKKLQKQGKGLDKQIKEIQQKLINTKEKLLNISKVFQDQFLKYEIMKVRCVYSTEEKQKQYTKIMELKKQQNSNQATYNYTTQQYNNNASSYKRQLSIVLSKFQNQAIERIQRLTQNMKKLMIFQTAMMRNFDYDIVNISSQLQSVNPMKDISSLVEDIQRSRKIEPKEEKIVNKQFVSAVVQQIQQKQFQTKLELQRNQSLRLFIDNNIKNSGDRQSEEFGKFTKNQKEVLKIVDSCWKDKSIDSQSLLRFKQLMDIDNNRSIFHIAFRQYNAFFFNKQMTKESSNLFQIAIQKSKEKKDIYTIRKLLSIIFSKWVAKQPNSQPRQIILYRGIQNNSIWKNQDFWDAATFQAIQENLKILVNQKGETFQQTKMKEQNIILSQLASFCHIMIMLGVSQKNVKINVGKYCRLHDLGEQENKVLSKTIAETLVTFKQFN